MTRNDNGITLRVIHGKVDTSLQQALDVFLLDARAQRLTAGTIGYYRRHIQAFIDFLSGLGVTDLAHITPSHVHSYFVSLQDRGLADNTQHAAARAAKRFLYFCVEEGLIDDTPLRKGKV